MHPLKLGALTALAIAGCAQNKTPVAADHHQPGALALTVEYTTLCQDGRANSTCLAIEYPEVCWSGTCTENCGGNGARSFHVCAPGGVRQDDPLRIEQRAAQPGLAAGKWQINATTTQWTQQCSTEVDAHHEGSMTVDSAWQTCS